MLLIAKCVPRMHSRVRWHFIVRWILYEFDTLKKIKIYYQRIRRVCRSGTTLIG